MSQVSPGCFLTKVLIESYIASFVPLAKAFALCREHCKTSIQAGKATGRAKALTCIDFRSDRPARSSDFETLTCDQLRTCRQQRTCGTMADDLQYEDEVMRKIFAIALREQNTDIAAKPPVIYLQGLAEASAAARSMTLILQLCCEVTPQKFVTAAMYNCRSSRVMAARCCSTRTL